MESPAKPHPKPIGPYSSGVAVPLGNNASLVFVSGMIPIDPNTGEMAVGGIRELTKRVILNIELVLVAQGCSLSDVVKTEIFLIDLNSDFSQMNEEYAEWFGPIYPARQTVQVAALPRGARIEISCIAHKKPD